MAQFHKEVRVEVDLGDNLKDLLELLEEFRELAELVPEWNEMEMKEIESRTVAIVHRIQDRAKVKTKAGG